MEGYRNIDRIKSETSPEIKPFSPPPKNVPATNGSDDDWRGSVAEELDRREPKGEVVIVDDNKETANSIKRFLSLIGEIEVDTFESGERFLEELKNRKESGKKMPQLVFMDYHLEKDRAGFNEGKDIVAKIREELNLPEIKIVAFSSSKTANESMMAVGADFVLNKLTKISEIKELVMQVLKNN